MKFYTIGVFIVKKAKYWKRKSQKRKIKQQRNKLIDFIKIINHFFKDFSTWIKEMSGVDVQAIYKPNQDTITAIEEVQQMINNNTGEHFNGSTTDFFNMLAEE